MKEKKKEDIIKKGLDELFKKKIVKNKTRRYQCAGGSHLEKEKK